MKDLEKAKELLKKDNVSCVLVKGSQIIERKERGVAPLLNLINEQVDCRCFSAADRVVGRGAAVLYINLGVNAVYGEVMSKSGKAVLEKYGISYSYGTLLDQILNRTKTDICPMEAAANGIEDISKAPEILGTVLEKMRANAKNE